MTRRPLPFKQADVTRACRGAMAAGLTPTRTEIGPDGKIVVIFEQIAPQPESEFDLWRAKRDARPA